MRIRRGLASAGLFLALIHSATADARSAQDASQPGDPIVTAAVNGSAGRLGRRAAVPELLSDADVEGYRRIIALQDNAQWALADREIARLEDPLLVGNLLAARYSHRFYRPKPAELKAWLARFEDLPEAEDMRALLAPRSKAKRSDAPASRAKALPNGVSIPEDGANWEDFGVDLSSSDRRALRSLKSRVRQLAKDDNFDAAERVVASARLSQAEIDELKAALALSAFTKGRDDLAARHAVAAAETSGDVLPIAHWIAGLTLWRQQNFDEARRHFERVANSSAGTPWLRSAGGFWAARGNLVTRRPEMVSHWLEIAASQPRSFYGMLGRRMLGHTVHFQWEAAPLTDGDVQVLERVPAARRAMAFLQIGLKDQAETELFHLYQRSTPTVARSMLALAHSGGMPDLALRLSTALAGRDGRSRDAAAYPVPSWTPRGGWDLDRALVLAVARHESGFNPTARSPAGAVGLMQLMPATARTLGGGNLADPSVSMDLGQRYIARLLAHDAVQGDLLKMLAGYNAGPGAVQRWVASVPHNDDPLLFLETLPARETRTFVQRVMTSLWIYRSRLDLPSPSLDAIAAGEWPLYDGAEKDQPQVVKNVAHR